MKRETIEDVLRSAILDDPQSYNSLAAETGISRPCLVRFVKKEGSLRLDHAATLCELYGLELVKREG